MEKIENKVELDTKITDELKAEAAEREGVRMFNAFRKEKGLTPDVNVAGTASTIYIVDAVEFSKKIRSNNHRIIKSTDELGPEFEVKEVEVDGKKEYVAIKLK